MNQKSDHSGGNEQVSGVRLLDERITSYKDLAGYQKHHRVPTSISDGDQRFLIELADADLDQDLQDVFAALRKSFGLKRRELAVDGPTEGRGVITTPFFNYEIQVSQAPDDPGKVLWQRAITEIQEAARVFAGPFEEVFGARFSTLEVLTRAALDLENIVDHIEDAELKSVKLDYDKDLTWCEVQMVESIMSMLIESDRIRISSRREVPPQALLESFLEIQQQFMKTLNLSGVPFLQS